MRLGQFSRTAPLIRFTILALYKSVLDWITSDRLN